MVNFLSGALTLAYMIAAIYFLHFWKRANERLFLNFGMAFGMLALNQFGLFVLDARDELGTYAYVLRILAFALILWGIVDKNVFSARRRR